MFMNKYSPVTAQSSPIIFLYVKFSVKQHIEPSENLLTQYVLLFLVSFIPPCFDCRDRHQRISSCNTKLPIRRIHRRLFGEALTPGCSGIVRASLPLSSSISDPSSGSQPSSLAFGLSRSPFQSSQFSMPEMISGALSS